MVFAGASFVRVIPVTQIGRVALGLGIVSIAL